MTATIANATNLLAEFEASARDLAVRPTQAHPAVDRDHLQEVIERRTAELRQTNARLEQEIAERRRVEATLRASEERLRAAQTIAHVGSFEWDLVGDRITWSAEMYRLYDQNPATFVPTFGRILALIHPEDRSNLDRAVGRALANHGGYRSKHRVLRPSGSTVTVMSDAQVLWGADGRPERMIGTALDITEHERIASDLARSRDELRLLASHVVQARETERADVAREIHEELGQSLMALKMDLHLTHQKARKGDGMAERLEDMIGVADAAIRTVRRLASQLRPALLDDEGLAAAVEWHVQEFERRTGIACALRLLLPVEPPHDVRLAVFRVLQESLLNVARHSEASKAHVRLEQTGGHLVLCVRDNGKGVANGRLRDPASMGIHGMRERVLSLNGVLLIRGLADRGTVVRARIPAYETGARRDSVGMASGRE